MSKTLTRKKPAKKAAKKRTPVHPTPKQKLYASLVVQLRSLLNGEHDLIANAANFWVKGRNAFIWPSRNSIELLSLGAPPMST